VRRRALFFGLLFLVVAGCDKNESKGIPGSGVQAKKTRNVPAFTRLWVGGALNVWVTVGRDGPMELKGDDNLLDHVTSRLENGVLRLDTDTRVRTMMPLELRLSTAELSAVTANVASKVDIRGLKAKKFEVRAAGAGKVTAVGTAEEIVVTGGGATQFDLTNVPASSANVTLHQAGTARFGYLERLNVTASGSSKVIYRGDPEIKQDLQRPARLIKKEP
jgi:hypothetical protein